MPHSPLRVTNPAVTDENVDLSSLLGGNQGSGSSELPQSQILWSILQVSVSTNSQSLIAANIYSGFQQMNTLLALLFAAASL